MSGTSALLAVHALGWVGAAVVAARTRSLLAPWALAAASVVAVLAFTDLGPLVAGAATFVGVGSFGVLPSGRPRLRPLVWATLVAAVVVALWEVPGLAVFVAVAGGLGGAVAALHRARPGPTRERRRVELVVLTVLLAAEVAGIGLLIAALVGRSTATDAVVLTGGLAVPVAVAAAAGLRAPRLDPLVEGVVALGGTLVVSATAVLVLLGGLGGRPTGAAREATLVALAAGAGGAMALPGVRARLRALLERSLFGSTGAPGDLVQRFGSRLSRAVPLDELVLQLAETTRQAVRAEAAEVWTGHEGRFRLAAAVPHVPDAELVIPPSAMDVVARAAPSGGTWLGTWIPWLQERHGGAPVRVAPLAHAGVLRGLVVARRAADDDPFDERDDQVLAELARPMSAALANAALDDALAFTVEELRRTNDELRASRARIVASGDAERRRIERDLHDGAQQRLVALAVKLRLAGDALADGDAEDAAGLLEETRADVTETIAELRALAHGIYPPLLASGGLAEALATVAARAALPACVAACPEERFAQAVETTVYFCCSEALQNAAKHAGPGARAVIRVDSDDEWLCFSVTDDGFGIPDGGGTGHGVQNMADRVGSLGGQLRLERSPGGGTAVIGRLPLGAERPTETAPPVAGV